MLTKRRGTVENLTVDIGNMSRALKLLARELDVPVIVLCQLSRAVESRNDKRPLMSDLRASGNLEQDADLVVMVYRAEYYDGDDVDEEEKGIAELIIRKHRNGPTGTVKLAFIGDYACFENLAPNPEDRPGAIPPQQ